MKNLKLTVMSDDLLDYEFGDETDELCAGSHYLRLWRGDASRDVRVIYGRHGWEITIEVDDDVRLEVLD